MSILVKRSASCLACLVLLASGLSACNPNRNPDDTDTNLVGIFDPDDLQQPVSAMVDFHMENQVIGIDPLRLILKSILAEAVLADVALMDYPEEGTCNVYDEIVGRAVVVPTNIRDGGEPLELRTGEDTLPIERDTELNPDVNPGFYLALQTEQFCLGPDLCLPAESFFKEDTQFDFIVPGGPDLPAGEYPGVLRTPLDFTLQEPDLATEIEVVLPNPGDLRLTWDPPSNASDAFTIRVVKPDRTKLLFCNAADTGSFTIPGEKLAELTPGRYVFMASRTKESFFQMIQEYRTLATSSVDWAGFLRVQD